MADRIETHREDVQEDIQRLRQRLAELEAGEGRHAEVRSALEESEQRFQAIFHAAGDAIVIHDGQTGEILDVNEKTCELWGYSPEEICRGGVALLSAGVAPYTQQDADQWMKKALDEGQPQLFEWQARHRSGQLFWVEVHIRFAKIGGQDRHVVVVRDVTERKRAAKDLEDSEKRLQQILDNATAVIYVKDTKGRYLLINRRYEQLFGVSRKEFIGNTDFDLFTKERADAFRANDESVFRANAPVEFEEIAPLNDGLHTYLSIKFPLYDAEGNPCAVCGISTDITQRKRAEEAVLAERQLLRKLLDMQERERRWVSCEIHDGMIQDMVAAKMILEGMLIDLQSEQPPDAEEVRKVGERLGKAIDEGRRMINGLRPMVIDEKGIVESIYYLIGEEEAAHGLDIAFTHRVQFNRLSPLLEITLFRIVSEALTNTKRHARTDAAEVRLVQRDNRLTLEIVDHGAGFDPAKVPTERFGLRGIRERTRLFGGTAKISSHPGGGTRVSVEMPLDQPYLFGP